MTRRERDRVRYEHDLAARRFVREAPDGATLDEIAAELGCTREHVRQIEQRALAKLRVQGWALLPPAPEAWQTRPVLVRTAA